MQVADSKVVSIHYTLKDEKGEILDSSEGQEPLLYLHGKGNIVIGLEKELTGKTVGHKANVVVSPEEGYGLRHEDQVHEVPLSELQGAGKLKVGEQIQVSTSDNQAHIASVIDLNETTVTLDLNHDLAGETLHFDIEILEIRDAKPEELEHGHVHGAGCSH